jgi:hypothetical protein
MERTQNDRPTFEIPLSSKPPDYRPGDGPALAPIRMSLDNDAGAFIVDKRVLPGKPINGELKLELYYIVGWPDLPVARVAILATKIHDYVSPWVLEDWEYQASLERDREQEREDAARKRKQREVTEMRLASMSVSGASLPSTPGAQKKRGRPSKAEVLARQIAQQASFGDEELANVHLPPASTNGPSLSTPQKRLARLATDVEELEETDTNEATHKQPHGDLERESDSEGDGAYEPPEESDEPEELEDGLGFPSLNSFLPPPPNRGYAQFSVSNLPSSAQKDSAIPIPPFSSSSHSNSGKPSRWTKYQLTTPVPAPSYPELRWKEHAKIKRITPVPPPAHPGPKPQSKQSNVLPPRQDTLVPTPQPPQQRKEINTPVPLPSLPHPVSRSRVSGVSREVKVTPVPVPAQPKATPTRSRAATSTPVPVPLHPLLQKSKKDPQSAPYTPIQPPAPHSPNVSNGRKRQSPSKTTNRHSNNSKSRKAQPPQPEEEETEGNGEPVWEVKWLEDDKVIEIEGQTFRYFRVRWEGDWPPDQNPTWEPEENIPTNLVQNYLKNRKRARMRRSVPLSQGTERPTPPSLKRKYSSVAEAFEGDIKDDQPLPSSSSFVGDRKEEQEEEDAEERLEVIEQKSRSSSRARTDTPTHRFRLDPALVRELAASFTSRFRG